MQNKKTEHNYIDILKNSLNKKLVVLDRILSLNKEQEEILKAETIDYDRFDDTIADKEECIRELEELDRGFQTVYDRVKEALNEDRATYLEDIKQMQEQIKAITDKSMDIQAGEARNRETFQSKVVYSKKEIKTAKTANKVAANYYQSMNKLNAVDAQFLDTKK